MVAWEELIERMRIPMTQYFRQRNGIAYMICPFHREKSASFRMHPDGWYNCFGCHACGRDRVEFFLAYSCRNEMVPAPPSIDETERFFRSIVDALNPAQVPLPFPPMYFAATLPRGPERPADHLLETIGDDVPF